MICDLALTVLSRPFLSFDRHLDQFFTVFHVRYCQEVYNTDHGVNFLTQNRHYLREYLSLIHKWDCLPMFVRTRPNLSTKNIQLFHKAISLHALQYYHYTRAYVRLGDWLVTGVD